MVYKIYITTIIFYVTYYFPETASTTEVNVCVCAFVIILVITSYIVAILHIQNTNHRIQSFHA